MVKWSNVQFAKRDAILFCLVRASESHCNFNHEKSFVGFVRGLL